MSHGVSHEEVLNVFGENIGRLREVLFDAVSGYAGDRAGRCRHLPLPAGAGGADPALHAADVSDVATGGRAVAGRGRGPARPAVGPDPMGAASMGTGVSPASMAADAAASTRGRRARGGRGLARRPGDPPRPGGSGSADRGPGSRPTARLDAHLRRPARRTACCSTNGRPVRSTRSARRSVRRCSVPCGTVRSSRRRGSGAPPSWPGWAPGSWR